MYRLMHAALVTLLTTVPAAGQTAKALDLVPEDCSRLSPCQGSASAERQGRGSRQETEGRRARLIARTASARDGHHDGLNDKGSALFLS